MSEGQARWHRAALALRLLAIDPEGLRGLRIVARSGPVRDTLIAGLSGFPLPVERLHSAMTAETLYGGTDITATLSAGRVIQSRGLLHRPVAALLTSAERWSGAQAAQLIQHCESHPGHALILLDEGASPEEAAPAKLTEWIAFSVDLEGIGRLEATPFSLAPCEDARRLHQRVSLPGNAVATLAHLAARFGVTSLRAPLFALRAAMAHAALMGRDHVDEEDIRVAAELVLAPRATRLPPQQEEEDEEAANDETPDETPPPSDDASEDEAGETQPTDIPEDVLIAAIAAALPPGLMEHLGSNLKSQGARGSGAGAKRKGNRRGRPLPSRPGSLSSGARVDLIATLRAAVPWQKLRRRGDGPVRILRSDIRLRRYESRSDRLLVFAVDASGSAALARLGEAKGAVEYLLAEAYSRRDHVALISFRGQEAELLLPPTRSLVQAKRKLRALPGGGGTPLAAGLLAAGQAAEHARAQGFTPVLAVLTDGRANIALDGSTGRETAMADADQIAGWLRASGWPGLVIDAGLRPERRLKTLAAEMGASYLPMPRADAERLSRSLSDALDA